ncbi:LAMI_0F14554g1_1 [Lachancea mirantina]|uniref:LAMI_0F14554g1_1 n=1 Tax=Lachancea mirantina TaxID=1230905 RepID=A0A1G4K403_9SACH|nr:LAMI_0F14554g1_1 [Lachancea mirantina]
MSTTITTTPIPREVVNWDILDEIVSLDEDNPDFSRNLIEQFLEQASTTFAQIDAELQGKRDLAQLASLGHFLRGSSAALGLQRIAWACERIQNLGRKREGAADPAAPLSDDFYADQIASALAQARVEFDVARQELSKFYGTLL